MKNKKIKVVYIQTQKDCPFDVIEIKDNLKTLQKLIGCTAIDIVQREIGGERLSVICDDEGLLKDKPKLSAIWWPSGSCALVGNLIIAGLPDEEGELTSLTTEQARKVVMCQMTATFIDEGKRFFLILDEEKTPKVKMTFSGNMESKEGV